MPRMRHLSHSLRSGKHRLELSARWFWGSLQDRMMDLSKVVQADFGSHLKVRGEYTKKEKLEGFLTLIRPIFLFMTPLNAASAAILSIRGLPSWQLCLAGFFTGAFAAAGVNTFNK